MFSIFHNFSETILNIRLLEMEKIKELANKTKDAVLMQAQNAKEHVSRSEYQKDPVVEEAKEKLEKLERAINRCETDLKDLSAYIAKLSDTSLQFTDHFRKHDKTIGRTENPKVIALDDFIRLLSNKLKEPQVMNYKQKIESQ